MENFVQIERAKLYLGDCRDILPNLGKVDVVVTDPPYKMEIHERGFAAKRDYYSKLDYGTSTNFELSEEFYQSILNLLNEVNMVFFCNKLMKLDIANWARANKFSFDELVMLKSSPAPLTNNQWLPDKEHVLHIWNDDTYGGVHVFKSAKVKGNYKTKCSWFVDTNYQDRFVDHPSAKPVYILDRILQNVSVQDNIVLDPFMGSGTTGIACIKNNRSFIGIEKDPKFFDIAVKRITEAYAQLDLFGGVI